ncbi:hypothetical protein ACIQ6U_21895 [Lysinibacillus fusiformis]
MKKLSYLCFTLMLTPLSGSIALANSPANDGDKINISTHNEKNL